MSDELDAILALAVDNAPLTASLSPETLAVLFYTAEFLQARASWFNPYNPTDEISDADWDTIEAMVAKAFKELTQSMIGQIVDIVTAALPDYILPCDGSTYNRTDYPFLYAALDTVYIIDADTFSVPDFRNRVAMGVSASHDIGEVGGEEMHQLTESELASHTHSYAVPDVPTLVFEPGEVPVSTIDLFPSTTGSAGGDEPHNNLQPYSVVRKGIVAW